MEMAADELHQLLIAHRIRCAFGDLRPLELRGPAQVAPELFLDRARARQMHLIRILQMVADLFEIFLHQRDLKVVCGVLVRICPWTGISTVHRPSLFTFLQFMKISSL